MKGILSADVMKYLAHTALPRDQNGFLVELKGINSEHILGPDIKRIDSTLAGVLPIAASRTHLSNVANLSKLDTAWCEFSEELVDLTHEVPSRSATMASIAVRSSDWRATMPAISAFSTVMSTTSRVSSRST